jgi:hypothetical protein
LRCGLEAEGEGEHFAAGPSNTRWAILGHEEKTVAAGYGESFPVPLPKTWIDKIEF